MLGGPEVFIELGYYLYITGNMFIELGAALVDLTNVLIGMGFAFVGVANSIASFATSASVLQLIANGILSATALNECVEKVGEIGEKVESIRLAMGGAPKKAPPPEPVKEDCGSLKGIVISLVNLVANIASKVD